MLHLFTAAHAVIMACTGHVGIVLSKFPDMARSGQGTRQGFADSVLKAKSPSSYASSTSSVIVLYGRRRGDD